MTIARTEGDKVSIRLNRYEVLKPGNSQGHMAKDWRVMKCNEADREDVAESNELVRVVKGNGVPHCGRHFRPISPEAGR